MLFVASPFGIIIGIIFLPSFRTFMDCYVQIFLSLGTATPPWALGSGTLCCVISLSQTGFP